MTNPQSDKRKRVKPVGISPKLLFDQVKATASWALTTDPLLPAAVVLNRVADVERAWKNGTDAEGYLVYLLAAHFMTVGTFSPTDVDQRIRLHAWSQLSGRALSSVLDRLVEIARWDMRPVSERVVVVGGELLAGHHGEWFSVMAGALGRALVLKDEAAIARTSEWIDAELAREARIVVRAREHEDDRTLLSVVTSVAHNVGDLSRVVDTWRPEHVASEFGARYHRLGHPTDAERDARFGRAFVYAGELNKRFMADENHRFLPLRTPRALRRERRFLLPFGPYLFDWGRTIGADETLDDEERAAVLLALLRIHERSPEERGCLRAIAGMDAALRDGIASLRDRLPAEVRVLVQRPTVRDSLATPEKDFLKRFHAGIER